MFISYSHRDRKWLKELMVSLKPYVADGIIDPWDDQRISAGSDWKQEIAKALGEARIGVLLVSRYFLASDFIRTQELPELLRLRQEKGLTLLWVLLGPCAYETTPLTKIEAANTDLDKSLEVLNGAARKAELTSIARKIHECASSPPPAGPISRIALLRPRERPRSETSHDEPATLTIRLDRDSDGRLEVGYFRAPFGRVDPTLLSSSSRPTIPVGALTGDILFRLLFPDDQVWPLVLQGAFGLELGEHVSPARKPLRARILTEQPYLASLPWGLTSWRGRFLVHDGWTFEVVADHSPTRSVTLPAPCKILVVAPSNASAGPSQDDHAASLEAVLHPSSRGPAEPDYFRVVRSAREFENAVRGMRPDLVYFHGSLSAATNDLEWHLDAPTPGAPPSRMSMSALRSLFREAPPKIVYMSGEIAVDDLCSLGPCPLGDQVPAVLADWGASTARGLSWLRNVIEEGMDPVTALGHAVRENASVSSIPVVSAFTGYGQWTTSKLPVQRPNLRDRFRLDRVRQRAMVHQHIMELVRSRRVEAMVACAAPGNLVDQFWRQALDHIGETRIARTGRLPLDFPASRDNLRDGLEQQLQILLEVNAREPMAHALRRHAPTGAGPTLPLLWLDWGVFGANGAERQPPLKEADLRAWLDFSCGYLTRHCPDDLRIVSYLAIETAPDRFGKISGIVEDQGRLLVLSERRFRCSLLDPLGSVSWMDLLNFLSDAALSTCPAPGDFASSIHKATGGDYEATIEYIERAEKLGWHVLRRQLETLRGGTPPSTSPGDDL